MKQFNKIAINNFNRMASLVTDTADTSRIQLIEEQLKFSDIDNIIHELNNPIERILTGFDAVDELFAEYISGQYQFGFRRKDIIILAGMSGVGKTSFAMSMFANLYRRRKNVIFFSLEMRTERTWDSFRYALSGYHSSTLDFMDTIAIIREKPKIVTKEGGITLKQLDSFLTLNPAEIIFIDYIDYLTPTNASPQDTINFKNLFIELKLLVEKHNCAIILLSQGTEDKGYRSGRPTLTNLYGGKAVRSAVDHVIAVYRNSKYNDKLSQENKLVTEIIGLKLRSNSINHTAFLKFRDGKMCNMDTEEINRYRADIVGNLK